MPDIVIKAENLGKKYIIGHQAENGRYVALRDVLVQNARGLWRKTKDLAQGKPMILGDTLEDVWALRDVSFEIQRGEAVGIIGRNGAGKSTLLKILSRITEPSTGRVTIKGRVASLLEVGTGFHPELTGRENIYLNGAILGMARSEIKRKFDEIVAFAEVEKFLDTPVKRYSSGMYVRLAFAVAAHLEPEILVVDEVLAVGDISFQKKCLGKIAEAGYAGRTAIMVSHNMETINRTCSRAIWLDRGICVLDDSVNTVVTAYERNASDLSVDTSGRIMRSPVPHRSAWIEWLEIRDDSKADRMSYANGEFMNLTVGIKGTLPQAAYFEWVLFTGRGHPATSGGTFFRETDFLLPTPSGILRARIGPIPLAEGRYQLHLRLGEQPGYEQLDVWEDAAAISISTCIPEPNGLAFDSRRGVVYIPADYSDGAEW
jgi:lipopolysaccharide transport system ATP-binding protein